ncbi:DUF1636 domain-containing protein [uncultured Tateyamaria sp.]|uniref:DUF1636 domain-containing protein n=1 Tax=uncultured Tateyamaria sp. TaxID=455651 RepID=UPI00260AA0D6|nr:DUF1636 domain-containing protein [uncultured Tateyamaria sp.]
MSALPPVELLVCVKCRRETEVPEGGTRPGEALHAELAQRTMPEGVTLKAVECLSNCSSGCSVAVRGGAQRWTYVYGNLMEDRDADTVVDGIAKYAATADGLVPWRERPEHFRKNCIARIPPQEF